MSKGLEALERLMNDYYEMCENTLNNDDNYQKYNLTSERAVIEKELKALKIIIDKNVNVAYLKVCSTLDLYNNAELEVYEKQLTQEEFDLLKGVLV